MDGVKVDTSARGRLQRYTVKLPVGEHTLNFSYWDWEDWGDGTHAYRTTRSADDLIVGYMFKPGRKYTASWAGNKSSGSIAIVDAGEDGGSVTTIYENGTSFGLGMDLSNTVGFRMSFQPAGFIFDMGKVSLGLSTEVTMSIGWSRLTNFGVGLSGGGMFNLFLNRNAGKAFGLGIGGGYVADMYGSTISIIEQEQVFGVPYLRAAIIPNRRERFNIYFEYYLKDLAEESPYLDALNDFGVGIIGRL